MLAPVPSSSLRRLAWLLLALAAAVLIALAAWCFIDYVERVDGSGWWPQISLGDIRSLIQSAGAWGVIVAMGLMVLHSFVPFLAEFVAIANGIVYGAYWGTVITGTGAMIGAFLAFALARSFGRPLVDRLLHASEREAIDTWTTQYGTGTLFLSRFIPLISFNVINYAAGLTRISWWTFGWGNRRRYPATDRTHGGSRRRDRSHSLARVVLAVHRGGSFVVNASPELAPANELAAPTPARV